MSLLCKKQSIFPLPENLLFMNGLESNWSAMWRHLAQRGRPWAEAAAFSPRGFAAVCTRE
jgi:hypothetical protein